MIEFDSDRKRMSVIVENKTEQCMELMMKGADMMVIERLKKDAQGRPIGKFSPSVISYVIFASVALQRIRLLSEILAQSIESRSECLCGLVAARSVTVLGNQVLRLRIPKTCSISRNLRARDCEL